MIIAFSPLNGYIETIAVRIDSLPCRFCFPALAKNLVELKSIKNVSFSEASNTIHITLMDKNVFNPSYLCELIERGTSYKIKDIKLTAAGKVIKRGHHVLLEMESSPRYLYLDKLPDTEAQHAQHARKEKHDKHEKHEKNDKGFLAKSRRAFDKTSDFVRTLFALQTKNQPLLLYYADKGARVRVSGSIHRHVDGSTWCIGSNVQLKEVQTPESL